MNLSKNDELLNNNSYNLKQNQNRFDLESYDSENYKLD